VYQQRLSLSFCLWTLAHTYFRLSAENLVQCFRVCRSLPHEWTHSWCMHMIGPPPRVHSFNRVVRLPPLTSTYERYTQHAGPSPSFYVIPCPRCAIHFTLCVDCFLVTTASVTLLTEHTHWAPPHTNCSDPRVQKEHTATTHNNHDDCSDTKEETRSYTFLHFVLY
jgi:hypothetical protein